MIKALAPSMRRGFSWVWLSIVCLGILPGIALGQTGKGAAGKSSSSGTAKPSAKAAAKTEAPKGKEEADEDAPEKDANAPKGHAGAGNKPEVAEGEEKSAGVEIFRDQQAAKILENKTYRAVGRTARPTRLKELAKQMKVMAAGEKSWDQDEVNEAVDGFINVITTPSVIQGLVDVELPRLQAANKIRDFREAVDGLNKPLADARKAKNAAFIDAYGKVLLAKLPPILKHNFYARIEAIILLSTIENVDALKVYTGVLQDKEQTLWVQLRALRGISTVAAYGARDLPARPAVDAAKAIVRFLEADVAMPWPAQVRALEALGSLRLAKDPVAPSKLEFANAVMSYLADASAKPEVRATAAWAMGMLKIDGAVSKFNYPLVAYYVGDVAALVGEQANRSFDKNRGVTELCTSLLLYKLHGAFEGTPEARDSGLLHGSGNNAAFAQSKSLLKQTDDQIAPVARTALALLRGTSGQAEKLRKELSNSIGNLRQFLDKNIPENVELVPSGQSFPIKRAEVAKAPGGP